MKPEEVPWMAAAVAVWVFCVVNGLRNLKQLGRSPHLMWWAVVLQLPGALMVYIASVVWIYQKRQAEQAEHRKRLEEQAKQEAQRKAYEEAYRLDAPRREAEERRQQEEARRRQAAQHEAEQRASASRLTDLMSYSAKTTADLRNLVQAAGNAVDLAEREFKGGFFVPFWEAVEQAANQLVECETSIQRLISYSTSYNEEARKLDAPTPPLQLILPDASHIANRMRSIVRQSQQKIEFTNVYHQREMIFQQRRTNELLAAGFTTLGQAINGLGDCLDSSFEKLTSSLDSGFQRARQQADEHAAAQREQTAKASEQAARDAAAQRKQNAGAEHARSEEARRASEDARRADDKLNNIQRDRKPFP